MARLPRDTRLETREARNRLPVATSPYWRSISPGQFVGYRKGPTGGMWWARIAPASVGRSGNYIKKSLGPADDVLDADGTVLSYKDALNATIAFAAELSKVDKPTDRYTVADAVHDYLSEHYVKEGRAEGQTASLYQHHILPGMGGKVVTELKAKDINRWLLDLIEAPKHNRGKKIQVDLDDPETLRKRKATANRILTAFKAALNHAYRAGRVPSDDAWRRTKPFKRTEVTKVRFLTEEDATRFLEACDEDFRHLVRAALLTGCRYGELINMTVGDFDKDNGVVHVGTSKSGKGRNIPLPPDGVGWFSKWSDGKPHDELLFKRDDGLPWGKSHQTRPMTSACEKANILPVISFHDLRHTYASFLASSGVSDQIIADVLGHADTRMTVKFYAHLRPDYRAEQIRANLPRLGSVPDDTESKAGQK